MAAPVKSTEGTSTLATVTASLGSASTAGNLLTLKVAADDYAASPPSGWTQSTGMKQETYHGGYFWWKISTGDTSVNYAIGSAANSSWVMEEYAGPFDGSPYDTSNGTLAVSSAGSATTPNITPSAGDRLVLTAFGSSNSSGDMSGDLTGFTNSFTHTRSSGPASATGSPALRPSLWCDGRTDADVVHGDRRLCPTLSHRGRGVRPVPRLHVGDRCRVAGICRKQIREAGLGRYDDPAFQPARLARD